MNNCELWNLITKVLNCSYCQTYVRDPVTCSLTLMDYLQNGLDMAPAYLRIKEAHSRFFTTLRKGYREQLHLEIADSFPSKNFPVWECIWGCQFCSFPSCNCFSFFLSSQTHFVICCLMTMMAEFASCAGTQFWFFAHYQYFRIYTMSVPFHCRNISLT